MESLLLSSGSDNSDTTSRDIPEPDVETSEVGANDKEHAEWLLGVFDLGEERWVQSERQGNLYGALATSQILGRVTYW